jgi:tRNA A37 N6-isopentenylltransferase MiaA
MIEEFIEFNKIKQDNFGILQSSTNSSKPSGIGFKEFEPYIQKLPEEKEGLLQSCVEKLQKNTRNYARKQITWFNNSETIIQFNFFFQIGPVINPY